MSEQLESSLTVAEYDAYLSHACHVVGTYFTKTFSNTIVNGPSISPAQINEHPTMFVSSHRSHADYMIGGIALNKMGISGLRFAAGDNLTNLPYIGIKFRRYGAFSVYRAKANSRNYFFELSNLVTELLEKKQHVIVFPEGGRSYSGGMLEMKNGILAAAIMAQGRHPDKTFRYVPMSVVYDELPELSLFPLLQKGKQLRADAKNVLGKQYGNLCYFGADLLATASVIARSQLNRSFGNVYVDYAAPINVNELVDVDAMRSKGSRNEFLEHRHAITKAGELLGQRLVSIYRILPSHVVASAMSGRSDMTQKELAQSVQKIVDTAAAAGRNVASVSQKSASELVDEGIALLARPRAVKLRHGTVSVHQKSFVEYYRKTLGSI